MFISYNLIDVSTKEKHRRKFVNGAWKINFFVPLVVFCKSSVLYYIHFFSLVASKEFFSHSFFFLSSILFPTITHIISVVHFTAKFTITIDWCVIRICNSVKTTSYRTLRYLLYHKWTFWFNIFYHKNEFLWGQKISM
jgi:hypothetical protein